MVKAPEGLGPSLTYRKVFMNTTQSLAQIDARQGIAPNGEAQAVFPNGWTRVDNDVWGLDVSLKAKTMFSVFQKFRDNKTGYCWPSYGTLAKALSVSRPTAIKAVEELVRVGLVKKAARFAEDGSQTSNGYWVAASAASSRFTPQEKIFTGGVKNFDTNQNHLTTTIQDSSSCPYVRNAREAETTEKLNPKPEREESPSSVLEAPLRGGMEKASEGGAWGDRVPLPAPKHVYCQRPLPSEDHATGSGSGVQGSPAPSPTPDVPKRPRKPSWNWMRGAPKRWADDGKPTTIPPTFVPSPRHVAFGEAWGLDVESIGKAFVAKHLREGTLVQCWDLHFAELLEMKRDDKAKAKREAEALKPELEAADAARQAKRREWSERLEAQKAGAVPPTPEFLALRPMMEELRRKYGVKQKPKGEPYGWRANSHVGGEPHGGPRAAIRQQRDPGVFIHPRLDPAPSEPGDPTVGGRGDDVRSLRRVEDDGGERRRVPVEGEPCGGDRQAVGAELRARGPAADLDQPGGGRDRPVPEVRDSEAGEDDDGAVDAAAAFFAWRRIRDAQLAG